MIPVFGGIIRGLSRLKSAMGLIDDRYAYEISFDGGDVMALPDKIVLVDGLSLMFSFDLYMPVAGLVGDSRILTYYKTPKPSIVIYMDNADPLLVVQVFDNVSGSAYMSVDWTVYAGAYHNLAVYKQDKTFTLKVDDVQVDQKATVDAVSFSLMDTGFMGAADNDLNQAVPNGTKIKNIQGILEPYRMYSNDAGTTRCVATNKVANVETFIPGKAWTQTDNAKRPTCVSVTAL